MTAPPWLQELRDLLACEDYAQRQVALQTWEQRWLVALQAQRTLPLETLERSRRELEVAMERRLQHELGAQLAALMMRLTWQDGHGDEAFVTLRGEVVAVCAEPQGERRADAD